MEQIFYRRQKEGKTVAVNGDIGKSQPDASQINAECSRNKVSASTWEIRLPSLLVIHLAGASATRSLRTIMAPITILLPSQESPVVPTPPVQLPLPQNALDVQQAAVAPILLWQISPAIDRVAALSSRKIISELYSGLCAGNEAGPIVNLVQDVLKRICGVDLTDETTALIVSAYDLKPNGTASTLCWT